MLNPHNTTASMQRTKHATQVVFSHRMFAVVLCCVSVSLPVVAKPAYSAGQCNCTMYGLVETRKMNASGKPSEYWANNLYDLHTHAYIQIFEYLEGWIRMHTVGDWTNYCIRIFEYMHAHVQLILEYSTCNTIVCIPQWGVLKRLTYACMYLPSLHVQL